jgi:lipopolysaccharide biosynthesis glycosyltransferase
VIRLFCGFDQREEVGYHVFCSSVIRNASQPVSFTPIRDEEQRDGSNTFTYARYRVAEMCGHEGWAIFADACDMVMLGDIAELWAQRNTHYAVQVVKHSYKTRHPIKYRGTTMQCPNPDYPRKNWSSLMLVNCAAPEWASENSGREAHQFKGFSAERIGDLPREWNVLVDEGQDVAGAKLLHYTAGIPAFHFYADTPQADAWRAARAQMESADV